MLVLTSFIALAACTAEPTHAIGNDAGRSADSTNTDDRSLEPAGRAAATPPHDDTAGATRHAETTWYVRTDGGDADQCTGRRDAAYPGSGSGHSCAWEHPFHALPPGGEARIAAGDVLRIGRGSYMIGAGAAGASGCSGDGCALGPVPGGAGPAAPTRILGDDSGVAPVLWGSGGVGTIVDLQGSSNVVIGHLEITDRDDCVQGHSRSEARCRDGGDWGSVGIHARASRNVRLHDLDIHGLAHTGINAGGLADWTVERVRVNANGRAGWDANVGSGSANTGRMVLREVEIGWNGCGERWRTGEPWACWGQQTGGYGDGLGTIDTGGQWLVEDSFIHHNTSDGLDFRYMDGADGTHVTVRRTRAVANAGNQVKVRGNATIENSVLVSECGYFDGRHFMVRDDHCRAGGNTLQLVPTSNDTIQVRHNTITGEGGVLIGANEGDSSSHIDIRNNVLVGFPSFRKPGVQSAAYYANDAPARVSWGGNLVWDVKNGKCPGDSICDRDPQLGNMTLAEFDARPRAGSPVVGQVKPARGISRDFRGKPRRTDGTADIGAIEGPSRQ